MATDLLREIVEENKASQNRPGGSGESGGTGCD
jgi:hypothetical protein